MSTKFNMIRDINGYNGFGLVSSDDKNRTKLAANVAQTFTVPSNQVNWLVIFSYSPGSNVFVAFDGTIATVPAGLDTAAAELNPVGRYVKGGQTISLISPDAGGPFVTALYYIIASNVN